MRIEATELGEKRGKVQCKVTDHFLKADRSFAGAGCSIFLRCTEVLISY